MNEGLNNWQYIFKHMGNIISTKNIECNYPQEKISNKELKRVDNVMRDKLNCYVNYNFLGETDNLTKIIHEDAEYLKSVNMTSKNIANQLDELYDYYWSLLKKIEKEEKAINTGILKGADAKYISYRKLETYQYSNDDMRYNVLKITDHLYLGSSYYKGIQYCPFRNQKFDNTNTEFNAVEIVIQVLLGCKFHEIILGPLSIHMIQKHCFFGGTGPNRIEPDIILRVLELYKKNIIF